MRIFVCIFPVHRCLALHCTDTGKVKFDFFEVTEWTSIKKPANPNNSCLALELEAAEPVEVRSIEGCASEKRCESQWRLWEKKSVQFVF